VAGKAPKADDLVQAELKSLNRVLAEHLKSDVLVIKAPIRFGLDDLIRTEIEDLHDPANKSDKRPGALSVIVETTGGFIEVVERISNVFRKHYSHVDFIVPNWAYSAGTVLVLSGDEIYMDYYSILGPIDPQLESENNRFVSGIGYLAKYKELTDAINKAASPEEVRAELAFLLKRFDPAELFDMEQAKEHAEDLLENWLSSHKFKDWKETESNKTPIDDAARKARARQVAEALGNPDNWHSHGRGIGIRELTGGNIKLKINNFGENSDLNKKVRGYYDLFIDYCKQIGANNSASTVLHCQRGIRRV